MRGPGSFTPRTPSGRVARTGLSDTGQTLASMGMSPLQNWAPGPRQGTQASGGPGPCSWQEHSGLMTPLSQRTLCPTVRQPGFRFCFVLCHWRWGWGAYLSGVVPPTEGSDCVHPESPRRSPSQHRGRACRGHMGFSLIFRSCPLISCPGVTRRHGGAADTEAVK